MHKPEFHLHLVRPSEHAGVSWLDLTVEEVEEKLKERKDVDTNLIILCTTNLFDLGYRIFIHDKAGMFEVTLGSCERTTREIKKSHNLPNLIISGEFEKPVEKHISKF